MNRYQFDILYLFIATLARGNDTIYKKSYAYLHNFDLQLILVNYVLNSHIGPTQ